MDDLAIGGPELEEALRQLVWINRLLGAAGPTVEGVARLWQAAGRPSRLSVVDVGAGSGDANRALLAWADRAGVALEITLVDIHPETCAVAARRFASEPRVRVEQGDAFALAPGAADIVTSALFTHHIPDAALPALYRSMLAAARVGVVVNDLHRHPLAWGFIAGATRLASRNRMIRHDGPLSVLRGFDAADLAALRAEDGLGALWYAWRPWFRWLVVVPAVRSNDKRLTAKRAKSAKAGSQRPPSSECERQRLRGTTSGAVNLSRCRSHTWHFGPVMQPLRSLRALR